MRINVLEYLRDTSLTRPQAVALRQGDESLTFTELAQRAYALSLRLRAGLPESNQPVAVLADKSIAAVVAIVATLMSGNAYCPLDSRSPPQRLARMANRLGGGAVAYQASKAALLEHFGTQFARVEIAPEAAQVALPELWADVVRHLARRVDADPCYVIFTSGSTGEPKGVTIAHRSVIDYIDWAIDCYAVDSSEVIASQSPFFFDNSTLDLYLSFATGATLDLVPEELFAFPLRLLEYLDERRISTLFWVPSVLIGIANAGVLDQCQPRHLRKVLFAGEVMPVKQLNLLIEKLPGRLFSNLYGPTEITVDCTYFSLRQAYSGPSLPIGYACRNTDLLVIDEQGREAAPGEPGELLVRGSSLALGYWNDLERTAQAFVQNPLHQRYRDPCYRTGDLVRRDESGCIFFLGRRDHQIKLMGYRIELGEIEAAALALPKVANGCALFDRERQRIVLVVQGAADALELRRELGRVLPKYMVPGDVRVMDALPMTPNGKIDRQRLAREILQT